MKFKSSIIIIILFAIISCSKKSILETEFNCNTIMSISDLKEYTDIKKNYKISIPSHWKTKLYFDEYQSDIFTADTLKQLSDSYIIDTSWKVGQVNFDDAFIDRLNTNTTLEIINSQLEEFLDLPTFWNLSKGEKGKLEFHVLDMYIKTSVDTYLLASVKVYGNKNINPRICEAIDLLSTMKFNNAF